MLFQIGCDIFQLSSPLLHLERLLKHLSTKFNIIINSNILLLNVVLVRIGCYIGFEGVSSLTWIIASTILLFARTTCMHRVLEKSIISLGGREYFVILLRHQLCCDDFCKFLARTKFERFLNKIYFAILLIGEVLL